MILKQGSMTQNLIFDSIKPFNYHGISFAIQSLKMCILTPYLVLEYYM